MREPVNTGARQADGVGQVVGLDELADEVPDGLVGRTRRQPPQGGQRVDVPDLDHPGEHEAGEVKANRHHRRLRGDIRRRLSIRSASTPAQPPTNSTGTNWQRGDHSERDAAVGQPQDEQRLPDELEPRAGHRDGLAEPVEPVVPDAERAERVVGGPAARRRRCINRRATSSLEHGKRALASELDVWGQRLSRRPARVAAGSGLLRATPRPPVCSATRLTRRSVGSEVRFTSRWVSSDATTLVIIGGDTRSRAARSPSVIGPVLQMVPIADNSVGVSPSFAWWRR